MLLLSVADASAREFMAEAVRCYHAGAYRAAIVVATSAAMNDLRLKLEALVESGGAPPPLVASVRQIQERVTARETFERQAIDAAQKDAAMLSIAEAKTLSTLFDIRNQCAHPSGHVATAEEARHVISSMIDVVLSRVGALGIVGVEDIMARIPAPTFFPRPDGAAAFGRQLCPFSFGKT